MQRKSAKRIQGMEYRVSKFLIVLLAGGAFILNVALSVATQNAIDGPSGTAIGFLQSFAGGVIIGAVTVEAWGRWA